MSSFKGYIENANGEKCYTLNDTGWIDLSSYLSSHYSAWGDGYRTPRMRKYNGEVILEGTIKGSGSNQLVATLPVGYRPVQNMNFVIAGYYMEQGKVTKLQILPSGRIELQDNDALSWTCLNGIRFFTD